jgi:hypothetical protein
VSYVFQFMLIDTMRQYAMIAAEEYLSKSEVNDEETQLECLQVETDAELAEDTVARGILKTWTSTRSRKHSPICECA